MVNITTYYIYIYNYRLKLLVEPTFYISKFIIIIIDFFININGHKKK